MLRGFSAPARLEPMQESWELERLLAHDDDPFNRWQAAQNLALRSVFARVSALRGEGEEPDEHRYVNALDRFLASGLDDPAFTALTLTLPSETDLAREWGENVDPDLLFEARAGLRKMLGCALRPVLEQVYATNADDARYSPNAASAGKRALRNAALDLVAAGDAAIGTNLAQVQFEKAGNMTDRLAAMSTLALIGGDARELAFARFYDEFAGDALVIDKWFALQACIPEEATTRRVHALMAHRDFSLANPNRVRALIGAFANGNLTRFHAPDGTGYDILIDVVLELDLRNPQIAARLLSSLRSWRTLEAGRRTLAETALKRVLAAPRLSRDLNDIATRALA